jgi:hypothetical protein
MLYTVKSSQREDYLANDSLRLQWKEGGSDHFLGNLGTRESQEFRSCRMRTAGWHLSIRYRSRRRSRHRLLQLAYSLPASSYEQGQSGRIKWADPQPAIDAL